MISQKNLCVNVFFVIFLKEIIKRTQRQEIKIKTQYELYIYNQEQKRMYSPIIKDNINWETERKNSPGKLTFTVVKDSNIDFQQGNPVLFKFNGANIFYGFIFSKARDKEQHISVVAYDQLRYLKNKHSYVYENKTASELISMIASDFNLKTGTIENTDYKIPSRIEDNATLFDIIQNAINDTLLNRNQMFVLFDDFGKLTLKNASNMIIPTNFVISQNNAQNFDYKTSIDEQTYNKIRLYHDNEESGMREVFITQDSANINKWGILQLNEKLNGDENPTVKGNSLLSLYNNVSRSLTIKDIFGDSRIRAGCSVFVSLNLGDLTLNEYMFIEKASHIFENSLHTMSLTLRKGFFVT